MSNQRQDAPSVKVVITGISGTGKSTLFQKLIEREKADWIFLYDHKGGDLARRFKVKACFTLEQLLKATERGGIVIYNPQKEFPGKPDEGFDWFCQYVWAVTQELKGKKIFGADELDALVDNGSKPDSLCVMLDVGRTWELECLFICHAMNGIHNQVRKQFTEVFALLQGDQNGAAWLAENCGFDENQLLNLKHGEWLYKNKNTGFTKKGGSAFVPKNSNRNLSGL